MSGFFSKFPTGSPMFCWNNGCKTSLLVTSSLLPSSLHRAVIIIIIIIVVVDSVTFNKLQ